MNTFVTGGSGFVGGNLIKMLVESGHRVCALARSGSARNAVFRAGAEPVEGELADVKALCAGMSGCETVFHCAAAMEFWNEERLHEQVNVEGTRNVVQACKEEGVSCLVFISAAAVLSTGGQAYFLTDTEKTTFREFITGLLATQGIPPGSLSLPWSAAWASAVFLEGLWQLFHLRGRPPITRTLLALIGMPIELSDAKARKELGYAGHMSRSAGLEELRHVFREH